ncbi:MAG TPA: prepilin-type N-terminal cleavage/methylation domain-containing protein [Gemmatimonadaceae bacterium]|nr:prepilin-type N-terminal cleavage/methylation domain-containing protein [Gemmatimonadaceae bacterium]
MRRLHKTGFTLIELLIVVVIIGILAAIAIPKFAYTKDKAFIVAMKSDLRNLSTAEEGYFYSNNIYSSSQLLLNFMPSQGVTIAIPEATAGGWSAQATNPDVPASTCAVYIGSAAAVAPATVEGQITCN